jgi:hypothetical protein
LARTVTAQKALQLTLERMQPEAGNIHLGRSTGSVEPRENVTQLLRVFPNHAARVVVLMKAFQSPVANRADHPAP